eukprot:420322-Hanusia_phi.AAC.4
MLHWAHAGIGGGELAGEERREEERRWGEEGGTWKLKGSRAMEEMSKLSVLEQWEETGEAIIVLRVEGADAITELLDRARDAGLSTYLVRDAGRTEVDNGTATVSSQGGGDGARRKGW